MTSLSVRALPSALVTLLVTILIYFGIDTALRLCNPFETYTPWGSVYLEAHMKGIEEHYKKYGRIDVLVLGSSVSESMDVGLWQRETSDSLVCYNFSVPGMHAENAEFYFAKYIYPRYKPKCVLYVEHPLFLFDDWNKEGIASNRFVEQFWESANVRFYNAETLPQKALAFLNLSSFIMQTNKYVRTQLCRGKEATGNENLKNVRVDEYGISPMLNWGREKEMRPVHVGRLSAHLSLNNLARLSEFCRTNFVKFYVVNNGQASTTWELFPEGSKDLYPQLLKSVTIPQNVIDAANLLKFRDDEYLDTHHLNAIGAERLGRFLFNYWISPILLEYKHGQMAPQFYPFAQDSTIVSPDFTLTALDRMPSPAQLKTDRNNATIQLDDVLEPGDYEFTLYTGRDTSKDDSTEVKISALNSEDNTVLVSKTTKVNKEFFHSGRSIMTVGRLDFPKPARMQVKVTHVIPGEKCILDSLEMRKMGETQARAIQSEPLYKPAGLPPGVNLVLNGDFAEHDENTTVPKNWECLSDAVGLNFDGADAPKLKFVAASGKFARALQVLDPRLISTLCGQKLQLSFTAQCADPEAEISGSLITGLNGTNKFTKHTAIPEQGEPTAKRRYFLEFDMPTEGFDNMVLELVCQSKDPAKTVTAFADNVRLESAKTVRALTPVRQQLPADLALMQNGDFSKPADKSADPSLIAAGWRHVGKDAEIVNRDGKTQLQISCQSGQFSAPVMQVLDGALIPKLAGQQMRLRFTGKTSGPEMEILGSLITGLNNSDKFTKHTVPTPEGQDNTKYALEFTMPQDGFDNMVLEFLGHNKTSEKPGQVWITDIQLETVADQPTPPPTATSANPNSNRPAGTVLMRNGDFKSPSEGNPDKNVIAAHWRRIGDDASIITSDGKSLLQMSCKAGDYSAPVHQVLDNGVIPVLAGKTVRLSFSGKCSDPDIEILGALVTGLNGTNQFTKYTAPNPAGSPTEFRSYVYEFLLPQSGFDNMVLDFICRSKHSEKTGLAWVTDVDLKVVSDPGKTENSATDRKIPKIVNIAKNGDFAEKGDVKSDPKTIAANWQRTGNDAEVIQQDGQSQLQISCRPGDYSTAVLQVLDPKHIPAIAGKHVRLSFLGKCSDPEIEIDGSFITGKNGFDRFKKYTAPKAGGIPTEFNRFVFDFTVPQSGFDNIVLEFLCHSKNTKVAGKAWITDVRMEIY